MTTSLKWINYYFTILCLLKTSESKYVEGTIETLEKWTFLERFCFLSEDGKFSFDIVYDVDYAPQKLLLYFDDDSQWPTVYKTSKTCNEKEKVMKKSNNQIINLTMMSPGTDCEIIRDTAEAKASYRCVGSRTFRSRRERWWFIAISNCDSDKGLKLNYKLTLTNGYRYWFKHYSADEFYILHIGLAALTSELGIFFLSLMAASELKNRHLFHTTYRLYMFALFFQIFGLLFIILHYARYGFDGMGIPSSRLLGRILTSISTIIMVFFLLLMGKGYNITRGRLRQVSAVRLTIFMCCFCSTYIILFIYEQRFFDPGEVLYIYESPGGYGLLALRCIGWLMFVYACFFTVKHYPEKTSFYYPFFSFYTLWFLSGPVIIIISNHVIDKWVREKVVNGVEWNVTILGHLFFLFLTRPNAANKNFPYHVRTSQIRNMESTMNSKGPGWNIDHFNGHIYAPEEEPKNFTNNDIFLVSGAMEMRPVRPRTVMKEDLSFPHQSPGITSNLFRSGSSGAHGYPSAPPQPPPPPI